MEHSSYRIFQTRIPLPKPLLSDFSSPRLSSMLGRGVHGGPDETGEFAGHSDDSNVRMFALPKSPEFLRETMLGLHCDRDCSWILSLTSSSQDQICSAFMSVVPTCLDQNAPDLAVSGLGDRTSSLAIAGGSLAGNKDRTMPRTASCSSLGTSTGVRCPLRRSFASWIASIRSVLRRSPGLRGIKDGATTSHEYPWSVRARWRTNPDPDAS